MSRKSRTGGVTAKGKRRIQFEFWLDGTRYRPTLPRIPTEANLRRAREQLAAIKERIRAGTFSFAEEFPNFRNLNEVLNEGSPNLRASIRCFPRALRVARSQGRHGDRNCCVLPPDP
jgi:Arm DNA-binding domain